MGRLRTGWGISAVLSTARWSSPLVCCGIPTSKLLPAGWPSGPLPRTDSREDVTQTGSGRMYIMCTSECGVVAPVIVARPPEVPSSNTYG